MKSFKIAVFTIVKNECTFLPIWWNYYWGEFPSSDIYIYDNDSDCLYPSHSYNPDGTPFLPVKTIHSEYDFDHSWLRQTAFKIMSYLLIFYDYVLCTDADEILIPDKKYKGIIDYVEKNPKKILYSTGYSIIGKRKNIPIDFTKKILKQRDKWVKLKNFYKPVISSVPIRKMYTDYNCVKNGDPELYLLHLNRVDYNTAYEKYKRENKYKWNPRDLAKTNGWQHRINNDTAFNHYYDNIRTHVGNVENIPDWIKEIV